MNTEIFDRIRREIALTVESARETIIAIADRVNRKTQGLKLHTQAAEVARHIMLAQQEIGAVVTDTLVSREQIGTPADSDAPHLHARLEEVTATVRLFKEELRRIDQRIADLASENLADELLKFQRDLSGRALTFERLTVAPEASAVGLSIEQLPLSPTTRVVAVFRGPALLVDGVTAGLRGGDVVLLLGSHSDLLHDRPRFVRRSRATA